MPGSVTINKEFNGEILILRISGQLDVNTSPTAESKIFDFIHEGHHKVLFDLSGLEFLSSAGMRMLLSITKKLKTISGKLILCSVKPSVAEVVKMSGCSHSIEVAESVGEGLRKF